MFFSLFNFSPNEINTLNLQHKPACILIFQFFICLSNLTIQWLSNTPLFCRTPDLNNAMLYFTTEHPRFGKLPFYTKILFPLPNCITSPFSQLNYDIYYITTLIPNLTIHCDNLHLFIGWCLDFLIDCHRDKLNLKTH